MAFERLTGMAMGVPLSLDDAADAFRDYMHEAGWEAPPEEYDWEGDYIRATAMDYGKHGRWIYVEELPEPRLEIARKFAEAIKAPVEVRQVSVRERSRGDTNFSIKSRTIEFTAVGESKDLDFALPDSPEIEEGFGDLYETAAALLGLMVHKNVIEPVGDPIPLVFYRPEPEEDDDGIDPRIKKLAEEIKGSGSWEIVDMMGQQMLRVELSDGTRQMSRVDDDEIELLKELSGVEPS